MKEGAEGRCLEKKKRGRREKKKKEEEEGCGGFAGKMNNMKIRK